MRRNHIMPFMCFLLRLHINLPLCAPKKCTCTLCPKNWPTCCTAAEIFGHQTGTLQSFLALCAPPMENLLTLWPETPTPKVPLNQHYFYKLKCTGSVSYIYSPNPDAV